MPAWKHSQYFFKQKDFLQLQPLCMLAGGKPHAITNGSHQQHGMKARQLPLRDFGAECSRIALKGCFHGFCAELLALLFTQKCG